MLDFTALPEPVSVYLPPRPDLPCPDLAAWQANTAQKARRARMAANLGYRTARTMAATRAFIAGSPVHQLDLTLVVGRLAPR